MVSRIGARIALPMALPAAWAIVLTAVLLPEPTPLWSATLVVAALLTGTWFLLPRQYGQGAVSWGLTIAAIVYVALPLGYLGLLREARDGMWWTIVALVITWSYDVGGYAVGSIAGKRPFMRHVSPSKTQEGVLGGLLLAAIAGVASSPMVGLPAWQGPLFGIVGGILVQTGDLAESMVKRQIGVKDSGTLVPGHGGMLDRIDGLLFVIPAVYAVALLTNHGTA